MRIEYKIFWVEDNDDWFEDTEIMFSRYLEKLGFVMSCKRAKDIDEVKSAIQKDGLQDYDLLLIDLKLGNDKEGYGNRVIELIRQKTYTEIIFYSSILEDVQNLIQQHKMEGVYVASREGIDTKFKTIVGLTIKKTQEVNTIRGLLMAETSDLDELMLEIINKSLSATDMKQTIENYAKEKMDEGLKNIDKKVNSTDTINSKINNGLIFTSFHKAKVINKICQLKNIKRSFFEDYNKDVIKTRNIFGHVKEEVKNGKKVLVSHLTQKEEIFDAQRCIDIRKTLIEYRKLLEEIKSKV